MCGHPLAHRVIIAALVVLCASCAGRTRTAPPAPPSEDAPLAPEVWLSAGERPLIGKVLEVTDDHVIFLLAPYWGVEPRAVPLNDITQVEVRQPESRPRRFVWGFAIGFTVTGILAGTNAEYNTDYEGALTGAAAVGALAGLVGALISPGSRTRYPLGSLSREERRDFLLHFRAWQRDAPAEEGTW